MPPLNLLRPLAVLLLAGCAVAPDRPAVATPELTSGIPQDGAPAAPAALEMEPPPRAAPELEGTRVLFLRLTLRTRRIEQELLQLTHEGMVAHLRAAADLLRQLRARYLTEDEALRADRIEQYLQRLVEQYAVLHLKTGDSP